MAVVETQLIDEIFVITLNKPQVKNAFDPEMIEKLTEAFRLADISSCRAVHLKGEGESFCAGADLNWMKSLKNDGLEKNLEDAKRLFDMFYMGYKCNAPLVTSVRGHVMGGATGLLSLSDIVIAERSTKFAFSEVRLGLSPATISPFVLRKMQTNKARELMLSGRVFGAEEALASGLVEVVVDESHLEDEVRKRLDLFGALGPKAVRQTKKLLNSVYAPIWNGLKDETASVIAELRVGDEGQEGLAAFFEKREASWKKRGSQ